MIMKNRIALITGGLGDLGTAICHEFIKNGAIVIAADHIEKEKSLLWQSQQKKSKYEIELAYVDVTQFESCADMAKEVEKRIGPVDILVNAAGTINDVTLRKMTSEQWSQVVHTDLDSMFNITRQFINGMIERGYGRIINISSVNAEKGQFGQTNYSSAKSGVYGFTKSLAQEVAKYGVTVNSISPGYVESRMVMSVPESVREGIIAQIPVGRLAKPEEIAWCIAFLASERSGFITGSNLSANGGVHMY
jgi:acetoacetyl-CoA reductase